MKKILLCLLLSFCILYSVPAVSSAESHYTMTDETKTRIRTFIDKWRYSGVNEHEGSNTLHDNAYVVYYGYPMTLYVGFFPEPDSFGMNGLTPMFHLDGKDTDGCHAFFYSSTDDGRTFTMCDDFECRWDQWIAARNVYDNTTDDFFFTNFTWKNNEGTVVFPRSPLTSRISSIAERQAGMDLTPKMVKIAMTILIIVASLLLSLIILPKLLKKLLRLLAR